MRSILVEITDTNDKGHENIAVEPERFRRLERAQLAP
jgi:hypothetical protein